MLAVQAISPHRITTDGNVAASLVCGLCKCVHEAHMNNTNLEKLRDRCLDLLDLLLHLGGFDEFISTSKSLPEPPELPQVFANITHRFIALVKHKQEHDQLYAELRDLEVSEQPQVVMQLHQSSLLLPFPFLLLRLQWMTWWLQTKAIQWSMHEKIKVSPVQGGAQLFLSYRVSETGRKRHGGDRTVPQLKSALEAQGYSVFVGESDIEGGASWAQAIQMAITDCQVFIPVCSKTYGDTKWTLRELHAADKANKEILPLWHSGDYPPKPVSMYLDHVQRLPRGNQPLVQANFQSLVSDLVEAVKKEHGCTASPALHPNGLLYGLRLLRLLLLTGGDTASRLLSWLCKCVHEAHVYSINLKQLRDQCLDLLDLILHLSGIDGFISTSRSSFELPTLPQGFANNMHQFNALVEVDATFALSVDHKRMLLEEVNDKLNDGMPSMLVALLKDKDSKDAFKRAVGSEDTIFISIDELCLSFPDDSPLLPTIEALLCKRRQSTPVKKERAPSAALAQSQQGRQKVSPVQGGAQLFLSYRVPETGRKEQRGDCTVPQLKSALESHGYSVFVGESDIEGGASWVQTIQVAITDCQVFIPVCSKTYGGTKWTLSGDYPPKPVSMYLSHVQRLPRGNQRLVQADFQSLVSDLVAAIKKVGGPAAGAGAAVGHMGLA
ncbi:hypothetical protein QJQ45_004577 [Haematococcus lacustris]|nr:hypothetical protein QJQ45_004577 [Haematococcus lacustris]